jgi:RNA polymerase sigma factor for flagellar operon FliA
VPAQHREPVVIASTASTVDVDQLVAESLPMVRAVVAGLAHHYPRHCDRDELVAAGTFGLVEAARRYDPSKGVPFDRWAALRIRGAVVDAVRAVDFAPRALRSSARDLAAVREVLERELGRTPTSEQVAERMGMLLADLVQLEGRLHRSTVLSLDAPTRDDEGDTTLAAVVLDPGADPLEELERRERDSYVQDALRSLPERLQVVLVGYFLEGRTSAELAAALGVTESRVSQMRTEALTLVREALAAEYGERTTVKTGRAAARQAAYNASLSARSSYVSRLSSVQDGAGLIAC